MPPNRETGLAKFGKELKLAREAARMTVRQLAPAINVSVGTINNWEQGKRCPDIKDVERIEQALTKSGYPVNGYLQRYLEEWVHREVSPEWSKWRDIEELAVTLYSYEHSIVNGLLQTEEYARVILGHDRYSPLPLDERTRNRLERQRIIDGESPPTAVFVFSEHVLHNQVGSRKTMHGQIVHLIELSQREEIIIQVVPQWAGYHTGQSGAFMVAKLDGREVALQDGIWRGRVLGDGAAVATLTKYWQHTLSKALSAGATLDLLKEEVEKWKA